MQNYQIYDVIGKGTHSTVYKGRRKKTLDYYAIKSVDRSQREKLVPQVQILHSLTHPNVLRFYAWYETRNHLWLVLEHCIGSDLAAIILQDSALPEETLLTFSADISRGLAYCHHRGVLLGDLNPANVLLDAAGVCKLADFSAARLAAEVQGPEANPGHVPLSELAVGHGTPSYMAPELFSGGCLSAASDLYSLGCCLYTLAVGHPPFPTDDIEVLAREVRSRRPPRVAASVSEGFKDLVEGLLEPDPLRRSTWADVAALELLAVPAPQVLECSAWSRYVRERQKLGESHPDHCLFLISSDCRPARSTDSTAPLTRSERNGAASPGTAWAEPSGTSGASRKGVHSVVAALAAESQRNAENAEHFQGNMHTGDSRPRLPRSASTAHVDAPPADLCSEDVGDGGTEDDIGIPQRTAAPDNHHTPSPSHRPPSAESALRDKHLQLPVAPAQQPSASHSVPIAPAQQQLPASTNAPTPPPTQQQAMPPRSVPAGASEGGQNTSQSGITAGLMGIPSWMSQQRPPSLSAALWTVSDVVARPVMLNPRVERVGAPVYDVDPIVSRLMSAGFDPAPDANSIRSYSTDELSGFVRTVDTILKSTELDMSERYNLLCYFESLVTCNAVGTAAAHSPIMVTLASTLGMIHGPGQLRVRAATVFGLIVRHATSLSSTFVPTQVVSTFCEAASLVSRPKARRRALAALAELTFYCVTAIPGSQGFFWPEKDIPFNTAIDVFVNALSLGSKADDTDPILLGYAVRALENLGATAVQPVYLQAAATPAAVRALLGVVTDPSTSISEHARSSAISAVVRFCRVNPVLLRLCLSILDFSGIAALIVGGTLSLRGIQAATLLHCLVVAAVLPSASVPSRTASGNVPDALHTALWSHSKSVIAPLCNYYGSQNIISAADGRRISDTLTNPETRNIIVSACQTALDTKVPQIRAKGIILIASCFYLSLDFMRIALSDSRIGLMLDRLLPKVQFDLPASFHLVDPLAKYGAQEFAAPSSTAPRLPESFPLPPQLPSDGSTLATAFLSLIGILNAATVASLSLGTSALADLTRRPVSAISMTSQPVLPHSASLSSTSLSSTTMPQWALVSARVLTAPTLRVTCTTPQVIEAVASLVDAATAYVSNLPAQRAGTGNRTTRAPSPSQAPSAKDTVTGVMSVALLSLEAVIQRITILAGSIAAGVQDTSLEQLHPTLRVHVEGTAHAVILTAAGSLVASISQLVLNSREDVQFVALKALIDLITALGQYASVASSVKPPQSVINALLPQESPPLDVVLRESVLLHTAATFLLLLDCEPSVSLYLVKLVGACLSCPHLGKGIVRELINRNLVPVFMNAFALHHPSNNVHNIKVVSHIVASPDINRDELLANDLPQRLRDITLFAANRGVHTFVPHALEVAKVLAEWVTAVTPSRPPGFANVLAPLAEASYITLLLELSTGDRGMSLMHVASTILRLLVPLLPGALEAVRANVTCLKRGVAVAVSQLSMIAGGDSSAMQHEKLPVEVLASAEMLEVAALVASSIGDLSPEVRRAPTSWSHHGSCVFQHSSVSESTPQQLPYPDSCISGLRSISEASGFPDRVRSAASEVLSLAM